MAATTGDFAALARSRHSVRHYEPGVEIDDATLRSIFETVVLSPSSFNVQHWRFVVVRDPARRARLRDLAYGQAQVTEAAAVILVCGRLDAWRDAERIYADAPAEVRARYTPMIAGVYDGQSELQRDEAVRSGALAAMSLMYAAKAAGWDSGPMIGFDAAAVATELELDAATIPVMMVVLGRARGGEQPARGYRRPLAEVVTLETAAGPGL